MRRPAVALVLTVALTSLAACGGAANQEWVREPEGGGSIGDEQVALEHDAMPPALTSDAAPQTGPHRLDHTVTLGEIYMAPPDPGAPGAGSQGQPSITVNVNNYMGSGAGYGYGYGYGGYGVPIVSRGALTGSAVPSTPVFTTRSGSSTVQPGQSFPAPRSFGPQFPYHLSPASPWETRH
ncbi:MAG TPA: hypothetical protein VMI54_21290 [Polyangiaceae bacterium]|nr:hypothetical protein [Polyangiaceae bacterium]